MCRNPNDHQFQVCGSVIDEGVRLVEADGYGVAFVNRGRLIIDADLAIPIQHVVDLFDTFVSVESIGRPGRHQKMVNVSPIGEKDIRIQSAAIPHRSLAAMIVLLRCEQCFVQVHRHEDRHGVFGRTHTSIAKIKGIVMAFDGGDVDVHELDGLVGGIVDGVGVAHPDRGSDGAMEH